MRVELSIVLRLAIRNIDSWTKKEGNAGSRSMEIRLMIGDVS